MPPMAEQRTSDRTVCTGCVRFTRLNREETVAAELIDFSEEGLGFISTVELKPGCSLRVQVEHAESAGGESFGSRLARSIGIVEVKWCRPVGDRWYTEYAAGVKYLLL